MNKWFHILEDTTVKCSLEANQFNLVLNYGVYALLQVIRLSYSRNNFILINILFSLLIGYLYSFTPYCGSTYNYNNVVGFGADVVMHLFTNVKYPMRHEVYFDNFFTSYHLLCLLSVIDLIN